MVLARVADGGRAAAAGTSGHGGTVAEIRVTVSFWEMVTWQTPIGQFGEWRTMTCVIMWLDKFRR